MENIKEIKRCVSVVLRNENDEVLVVEHAKCKHKFNLPAGTLEDNEVAMGIYDGSIAAAVREMKEELNLDLNPERLIRLAKNFVVYNRIEGHRVYVETVLVYQDIIKPEDITNMEPDKHPSIKWINRTDVLNNPEEYTHNTWCTIVNNLSNSSNISFSPKCRREIEPNDEFHKITKGKVIVAMRNSYNEFLLTKDDNKTLSIDLPLVSCINLVPDAKIMTPDDLVETIQNEMYDKFGFTIPAKYIDIHPEVRYIAAKSDSPELSELKRLILVEVDPEILDTSVNEQIQNENSKWVAYKDILIGWNNGYPMETKLAVGEIHHRQLEEQTEIFEIR